MEPPAAHRVRLATPLGDVEVWAVARAGGPTGRRWGNDDTLRQLLLDSLSRVSGRPVSDGELWRPPCPACGKASGGKPLVAGADVHFSMAYASRLTVAAVARCPVGVDVEDSMTNANIDVASAVFRPDEMAVLNALSPPARARLGAQLWVRKEAYLKYHGWGLPRALEAPFLAHPQVGTHALRGLIVRDLESFGVPVAVCYGG